MPSECTEMFYFFERQMNTGRDRSSGWRHAKLSGHENEADVEKMFADKGFCESFAQRLGVGSIVSAGVGGLYETSVASVLGGKTKSKTDLRLNIEDGSVVNISIKKSWGGQVYLIDVDRFIEGFQHHFRDIVPDGIRELLHIYFYGSARTEALLGQPEIVKGQSPRLIEYQREHNRLVWKSLCRMDAAGAESLLCWFMDNIGKVADFCFSRGLAEEPSEWADYVWYVNLLGEEDMDVIFPVKDICKAVAENSKQVQPTRRNGGSTILLPFGFVQWHQAKMQFHHSLGKLLDIVEGQR